MRRLFIIRKDLHLSNGKLAAMVSHCCEAYWTNILKQSYKFAVENKTPSCVMNGERILTVSVPEDIWNEYVNGIFTKTICEARNLRQLEKVELYIDDNCPELEEGVDYGYIRDKCLTELTPENEDGTTTVGVWFRPLPDEIAHKISKKFKLYRDEK